MMNKKQKLYQLTKHTTTMKHIVTYSGIIKIEGDWELEFAIAETIQKIGKKRIANEDQLEGS